MRHFLFAILMLSTFGPLVANAGSPPVYGFDQKVGVITEAANRLLAKSGDQVAGVDQSRSGQSGSVFFQSTNGKQCRGWFSQIQIGRCVMRQVVEFYCDGGKTYRLNDPYSSAYQRCPANELKPQPYYRGACIYDSIQYHYCPR